MSGFTQPWFFNQNMGKTDSYDSLNDFIIEFFYYDVRNKNNLKKIFELFNDTKSVLQFDKYINVTILLQKVSSKTHAAFERLQKMKLVCYDDSVYDTVTFEASKFCSKFLHCSSNIGHIIESKTLTQKFRPTAVCHHHNHNNEECATITNCYWTTDISKRYINDVFFNDLENFVKNSFKIYSTDKHYQIFITGCSAQEIYDSFRLFSEDYTKLNESAKLLYEWFYDMFPKRYENYTENERLNFHKSVEVILCHDIDSLDDLDKLKNILKENALNLGMYYYMRLMTVVNMMGWFTVDYYYKMLSEICDEEKNWALGINEKEEFIELVKGFMLIDFSNDGSPLKKTEYLKKISKFLSLKDGLRYVRKCFNEVEKSNDLEERINKYYDDLKELLNVVEQYPLKD